METTCVEICDSQEEFHTKCLHPLFRHLSRGCINKICEKERTSVPSKLTCDMMTKSSFSVITIKKDDNKKIDIAYNGGAVGYRCMNCNANFWTIMFDLI